MKRMGILGPRGTHSEAAAEYWNGILTEPAELVICPGIYEVLRSVEEGAVDIGFVPVENSLEGSINITLDTLARSDDLEVFCELVWPVRNLLMAKCAPDGIRCILSHEQPISQCRKYLRDNYPDVGIRLMSSTAKAAETVGESAAGEGLAAICTKKAGEIYGLSVIAEDIQDNMANSTRFFAVRKSGTDSIFTNHGNFPSKTLVICQIDGKRAGSLCEVLEEFAKRGINMTRIESRPARTELGAYIFFFDLDADAEQGKLEESIEAVKKRSFWLRHLGIFPVVVA